MTNNITTAAGLGNCCENHNCGKPLKLPYYLTYPLTGFVNECIRAECRTLEEETKPSP